MTTEKPMDNQEPIKSETTKTTTKPHDLHFSEEGAHPRSDSRRIRAETAKSRTACQRKCTLTWIQKSQSSTFTSQKARSRNWPTGAAEIIYLSIKQARKTPIPSSKTCSTPKGFDILVFFLCFLIIFIFSNLFCGISYEFIDFNYELINSKR